MPGNRLWLAALALLLWSSLGAAQSLTPYTTEQAAEGRAIRFTSVELIFARGSAIPQTGWKPERTLRIFQPNEMRTPIGTYHTLWGRVRFDRSALDPGPLALYTSDNREQLIVYLNGTPLFRNYATPTDNMLAWYRPYVIPLPASLLRPGANELVIRAEANHTVGIGHLVIGPHEAMQARYLHQNFWRITGPSIANYAMLVLGAMALLLWLVRRAETELLWLATTAGFWFVRNYHYHADQVPFDIRWFDVMTLYSSYFSSAASAAFCLTFLRVKGSNRIIGALFGFGVVLCAAHWLFDLPDTLLFVAGLLIGLILGTYGLLALVRRQSLQRGLLASVMLLLPLMSIHDVGRFNFVGWWDGLGFYLNPYLGFIFCIAFLSAFGLRALGAFSALESVNARLEAGIAKARDDLAASEAKRRALEVDQAVSGERARLMQEMHDGIGTNLIIALAVAEQQKQPKATIKTLRRAILDLKITVDSLEPVEGDLVALLGNLRHRMQRDLRDAGLTCKWAVEPCASLPWLDATNALHVLRIFQEAIGNVLAHSGAGEMTIGCREDTQGGVAGIAAYVADNGAGFDTHAAAPGQGIANIRERVRSLHGHLECVSKLGAGTIVTLWLPFMREAILPPPARR